MRGNELFNCYKKVSRYEGYYCVLPLNTELIFDDAYAIQSIIIVVFNNCECINTYDIISVKV